MATSDYTGRKVDLFIMQGAKESGMQPITLGLDGDNGGKVTTGVQKAAQLFTLLFLTEKGSMSHGPEVGTNFLASLRQANVDDSLMQIIFAEASQDILDQQARFRQTDDKDDELLAKIELLSFSTPDPTQMELLVQLTTSAGSTRRVVLPVSLAIR